VAYPLLKESIMKVTAMLNRSILATLLLSASVAAFAGGGGGARGADPYPYSATPSHGHFLAHAAPKFALHANATSTDNESSASSKTSAQVRAE
jgi:hypothetical protein